MPDSSLGSLIEFVRSQHQEHVELALSLRRRIDDCSALCSGTQDSTDVSTVPVAQKACNDASLRGRINESWRISPECPDCRGNALLQPKLDGGCSGTPYLMQLQDWRVKYPCTSPFTIRSHRTRRMISQATTPVNCGESRGARLLKGDIHSTGVHAGRR